MNFIPWLIKFLLFSTMESKKFQARTITRSGSFSAQYFLSLIGMFTQGTNLPFFKSLSSIIYSISSLFMPKKFSAVVAFAGDP